MSFQIKAAKKHFFLSGFLLIILFSCQSNAHVPAQNTAEFMVGNLEVRSKGVNCTLTLYDIKIGENYYFYSNCPFLKKYDYWSSYGYGLSFGSKSNSNLNLFFILKSIGFVSYKDESIIITNRTDLSFLQKLYAKLRS